jgi:hypothetical protein
MTPDTAVPDVTPSAGRLYTGTEHGANVVPTRSGHLRTGIDAERTGERGLD